MMGKMVWHMPAFFYLDTYEKLGLLMLPGFVFVKNEFEFRWGKDRAGKPHNRLYKGDEEYGRE